MRKRIFLPVRRFAVKLLTIIGDEYALALTLLLLLKFVIGERWEVVSVFNSYIHLVSLPLIIWLIVSVVRRRWLPATLALLPILFLIISYGPMFLPRSVKAAPDRPHLKLLTYNIHSERVVLQPMVELIRSTNADIIVLQELSAEAAERFEQDLSDLYPHQAVHTFIDKAVVGQGVLSRFPLNNSEYWRNEHLPVTLGHQRVEVEVNGTTIILYNSHPMHPLHQAGRLFYTAIRSREIDSVLDRVVKDTDAIILAGDFNMTDQSEDYQRITAQFNDAYRAAGWGMGFTFPNFATPNAVPLSLTFLSKLPIPQLVRLDYVFHSKSIDAIAAKVWHTSGGSDHRPVYVELVLPQ